MIVIKEEFVGGEKWRRAAKLGRSDALVMWLALKCYASQNPSSEGFVPNEDIDDLPGAPRGARKALQALVECGRLLPDGSRGPGLVDPAPGGWQLHDYLDHSASPEELELRREKGRLKKQRQREEKRRELELVRQQARDVSRGTPGDTSPGTAGDIVPPVPPGVPTPVPPTPLPGARLPAPAPTRASARPQPNPTHSNPTPSRESPDPEPPRLLSAPPLAKQKATLPAPAAPEGYTRIPKPYQASAELVAAAAQAHVSREELDESIAYWKARVLPSPIADIDQFFVAKLTAIFEHYEEKRAKARLRGVVQPQSAVDPRCVHITAQTEHVEFAKRHALNVDEFLAKLRANPRSARLSTIEGWTVLMRMLERAAGVAELGGAA